MEEVTEGVANLNVQDDTHKKNRIQVSNTKKPLFFYVNLAKVLHHTLLQHYSYSYPNSSTWLLVCSLGVRCFAYINTFVYVGQVLSECLEVVVWSFE